jgi:hypothetical protein
MLLNILHGKGQIHNPVRIFVIGLLNALAKIRPLYQPANQGLPDPFPLAQTLRLFLFNPSLAQTPHRGSHIFLLLKKQRNSKLPNDENIRAPRFRAKNEFSINPE